MPTISLFFNIKILMFWNDHAPPHFHAAYVGQDEDTIIDIRSLEIMQADSLKRRALGLVLDWAELHRDELLAIGSWRERAGRSTQSHRWSRRWVRHGT